MGIFKLHISERAETDVTDATDYYDDINPELGNRFIKEIYQTYELLQDNPQYYSYISSNPEIRFRDVKLKSFPYLVIYEIVGTDVFITAVMHSSRKPL